MSRGTTVPLTEICVPTVSGQCGQFPLQNLNDCAQAIPTGAFTQPLRQFPIVPPSRAVVHPEGSSANAPGCWCRPTQMQPLLFRHQPFVAAAQHCKSVPVPPPPPKCVPDPNSPLAHTSTRFVAQQVLRECIPEDSPTARTLRCLGQSMLFAPLSYIRHCVWQPYCTALRDDPVWDIAVDADGYVTVTHKRRQVHTVLSCSPWDHLCTNGGARPPPPPLHRIEKPN